jgi:glycosyltransferase involved in cell wall biosynthesis
MRIDIITPAFNVAPFIGDAIRSVLAQTHPYWSMTIVDDGSTDETAAVAAGFEDRRIRLLRQRNAGVSAARNLGLVASNAEAVLFLDADDWLSPDALLTLSGALRAAPNAVAAVGPYRRVPERGANSGPTWRPASGDLLESLLVRNLFANGGHLLIRRHVAKLAGSFQTGLSYGEDWEYWTRLARFGSFAAAGSDGPLLFVRERSGGAYRGMAARPESYVPCMDLIYGAPALKSRFSAPDLARLRRRAEAENNWVVGRELVRHGRAADGRPFLRRSVMAAPSLKRLAMLAVASLPLIRVGPFRSYPVVVGSAPADTNFHEA